MEHDIINLDDLLDTVQMKKRTEYLKKHNHSVWKGNDGYYHTYFDGPDGRQHKKKKNKNDLEDDIFQHYRDLEENPTFEEAYYQWIEQKLYYNEIQKSTYDKYNNDFIRFFKKNRPSFRKKKISAIDDLILEEFIKLSIKELNLTSKSYSSMRTLLIGTFKFAKRKRWTTLSISEFFGDIDISQRLFRKKIVCKEKEVFSEEEAEMISNYCRQNPTIRNLGILLTFQSGVRVGELCALKREDINFHNHTIHIQRTEIKYKNDDKKWITEVRNYPKSQAGDRYIILPEHALQTLNMIINLNPFSEYLFEENHARIKEHAFARRIIRICDLLKIPRRSMHKIRKTYGTTLINANVDDIFITEQMGHRDIKTTRQFYYFSNKSTKEKIEQIEKSITL